jgi:aspartyl-tRNA(Asn)/glutamyl-tRNA(Gln) amidotransferase subunit A
MIYSNIKELSEAYVSGRVTPRDYVTELFSSIESMDKDVQAVVRVYPDLVLKQVALLEGLSDEERQGKTLYGIPFLVKDNILVEGFEVTAQSKILEGYTAVYTSDVVRKLQEQGAIAIGQTNMDEFAFGSSTEYSGYGQITKNPNDLTKVAGGTSGGSAAAIALGLVPFALGSDTGGSIRQPASFTGIYGLRPTYGSVSRYGVIPSASSFDQVGPMANSLDDIELVYSVLKGKEANDQSSIDIVNGKDEKDGQKEGGKLRVAIAKEFLQGLDPKLETVFQALLQTLRTNPESVEIVEVSLPLTKYILPVYYILQTVEASSNLERFDQIRYAKSVEILTSSDLYYKAREEKIGEEAKRRIMLGTYASSAGYYDAYYNQACKVRSLIQKEYQDMFESVDLLLMPASPFPAFDIGGKVTDPMAMYTSDIMTVSQPIARLPGLVIPFTKIDGLPVGLQLVGPESLDMQLISDTKTLQKYL